MCRHAQLLHTATTYVLLLCLAPEPSANVYGHSHLCIINTAGDVIRKPTVTPPTVNRTVVASMYGVRIFVEIVRRDFVKAQPKVSCIVITGCWYNPIVLSAVVHNLGWVEQPSSRPVPVNVVIDVSFVSVHCALVVVGHNHHFCWR